MVYRQILSYFTARKMPISLRDLGFLLVGMCLAVFPYLLSSSSPSCGTGIAKVDSTWISSVGPTDSPKPPEILELSEQSVSDVLYENVRIFCFIISTKNKTEHQASHVHATWAKRCNKHVFVTTKPEAHLPTLDLGLHENRTALFKKIEGTLKYIYKKELNNFDYFLKADIDTYFAMDNLRFLLLPYSPKDALHFGCQFKYSGHVYMSGGAGYVFSREAVRRAVEQGFSKHKACNASSRPGEDVEIGTCMRALNVTAVDTRDSKGRHRFLPFTPMIHLNAGQTPRDHKNYFFYNYTQGSDCCGEYLVSFHYLTPQMMYVIDGFLHRFRLIGSSPALWSKEKHTKESLISALRRLSSKETILIKKDPGKAVNKNDTMVNEEEEYDDDDVAR